MFKSLKEKLKNVLKKISQRAEAEAQPTLPQEELQAPPQKTKPEKKTPKPETKRPEKKELPPEEKKQPQEEQPQQKKGFFHAITQKITTTKITDDQFDNLFTDLEITLLENNVALSVVDSIRDHLKHDLVNTPLKRGHISDAIATSLKNSIRELLITNTQDLIVNIRHKKDKPYIIVFVGVNGSGKTTTIAKIASLLKQHHITTILVAGDTWRAASIQQLEEHGKKLGIKVIKQDYGSDPAAVAYDGIKAAQAQHIDTVLIDTAGRQHSNKNLMEEMKKIIRIAKPDLKIFIGESITGNDSVEQSQAFNDAIGIDGIILTKSDVDEKGGAIVSISHVTKKPILYLGSGQHYNDIEPFNPDTILQRLGL